jgi:hypothetical protein
VLALEVGQSGIDHQNTAADLFKECFMPEFEGPYKHRIPDGSSTGTCKLCNKPIVWLKSKADKWFPVEPDGTFHPAACPERDHPKEDPKATVF